MLVYAVQRWREANAPVMMLMTIRQEAVVDLPTVKDWFTELERNGRFTRITLSSLTSLDIVELIQVLTQQTAVSKPEANAIEEFAQWLHNETGGSPFFLETFLRLLMEQEGLTLSRSIDNLYNQYSSLLLIALIYFEQGLYGASLEKMHETIDILTEIKAGQLYESLGNLCLIYGELGVWEKVQEIRARIIAHIDEIPEWTLVRAISQSAQASVFVGDVDEAADLLSRINGRYSPEMSIYATVPVARSKATLLLQQNKLDDALAMLDAYLPNMTRSQTRVWGLPELYYLQGKAHLAKGDIQNGKIALDKARTLSKAIGERRFRWRILLLLAELEASAGNKTFATEYNQEARTTLEFIIEQIPEGKLRALFLALPTVKAINQ